MATQLISLPATHLSAKLRQIRADIVSKYLQPQIGFPFFEVFFVAGLLPSPSTSVSSLGGESATRLLGGRERLVVKGDMLINDGPSLECPFSFEIFEQPANKIMAHVPKSIRIRTTFDVNKLVFDFLSPMTITFLNKPIWGEIQKPPLPFKTLLNKMTFTDAALDYDLADRHGSGDVWTIRLKL